MPSLELLGISRIVRCDLSLCLAVLSADLGGNGWAVDGQFPWIPLLFFILLSLSCTDIVCDRCVPRAVTRPRQIMARWGQVGIFLAYLENLMSALLELPTDFFKNIDFPSVESERSYEVILARLSQDDAKRAKLEQNYLKDDLSAKIADDRTHILAVLDDVRQSAKARRFPCLLASISKILDLIEHFQNSYTSQIISSDIAVFEEIRTAHDVYKQSASKLLNAINSLSPRPNSRPKAKHHLKQVAKDYAVFAFEAKDHLSCLSLAALVRMQEANLKLRDGLAKDLSRATSSHREAKSHIWASACTILTYLEKEIETASKDISVFETVEEAKTHLSMLSDSEVNDFLLGLDDDWHRDNLR